MGMMPFTSWTGMSLFAMWQSAAVLNFCICIVASALLPYELLTLLAWVCRMEFGRRRRPLRVEWAKVGMKHTLRLMMIDYDALMHLLLRSPVRLCSCSGQADAV